MDESCMGRTDANKIIKYYRIEDPFPLRSSRLFSRIYSQQAPFSQALHQGPSHLHQLPHPQSLLKNRRYGPENRYGLCHRGISFSFYSSDNDVMKRSGTVFASLARHKCIILLSARSQFIILWASLYQISRNWS